MTIEQQKLDEYIRQQKVKEDREQIEIVRQHRLEDKREVEKLQQGKTEVRIVIAFLIVITITSIIMISK